MTGRPRSGNLMTPPVVRFARVEAAAGEGPLGPVVEAQAGGGTTG